MRFIDYVVILIGLAVFFLLGYAAGADAETDAGTWEASCYGSESGPVTASGEKFEPGGHTAASRTLPFGTRLLVRHEGRGVAVSVTDRGPFVSGRDLDLSEGACRAIGLDNEGVGAIEVQEIESTSPSSEAPQLPKTGGQGQ